MNKDNSFKGPIVLLKEAFNTFKKYPLTYFKIVSLSLISLIALVVGVALVGLLIYLVSRNIPFSVVISLLVGIPLFIYISTWFSLAQTKALLINSENDNVTPIESLKLVKAGIFSFMFLQLLSGLIIFGGAVLLIIPAIIFSFWFSLSTIVFVKEGRRGFMALLASREYLRGYMGIIFLYFLGFSVVRMIFSGVITYFFKQIDMSSVGSLINFLINIIIVPLTALFWIKIYEELKRIKGKVVVENYESRRLKYIGVAILGIVLPIIIAIFAIQSGLSKYGEINNIYKKEEQKIEDINNIGIVRPL